MTQVIFHYTSSKFSNYGKQMNDAERFNFERLLFRMQHIIPRNLSSVAPVDLNKYPNENPQEIEFQMTFGKISAKVWGPPDGHPVFALHGWLDNAASFDTIIPQLPQNLRIVAFDMPGHGLSDHFPPDVAYNFQDALVAIERFSRLLKWQKFSLIGHSLGGTIAMMYAGIYPERVVKLVNIDIVRVTATISETMDIRLRKTIGKLLKYETATISGPEKPMSYEAAVEKSINGSFGSLDEKACGVLFKRGLKQVDGGYVFRRDRRLLAAPLSFVPKPDQLILAAKVTADVLIIKFTDGPYFESREDQLEHVEALKKSARTVRYVEVEGKHHAHLTSPERIVPIISAFLVFS